MQGWLRFILFSTAFAALFVAGALSMQNVRAEKIWNWRYTGSNVAASGTITTSETVDSQGFYQISSITGHRNGELITRLYPSGSAIPGNEPYVLDNLIRTGTSGQITLYGFGFSTVSGNYVNLFFADFLTTPATMEMFTTSSTYRELPVTFLATPVSESEINVESPSGQSGNKDE
ncbi:hypothetical protein [Nitrosomonas sp.]|uniref:hypothetical protein n=1 Tax=Nitrosomonas sp. TaxID=42353 RepID=UPI00263491FC|nr:hypothetical protein [Nitrosomonas sp.]